MKRPSLPFSIAQLIKAAGSSPKPFPEAVLVYGAGNKGRQVCGELLARGIQVPAVLDAKAVPGQLCAGIPVLTPVAWVGHDATVMPVVIAIHNENTPIPPIQASLAGMGFACVLTPIDLYDAFPDLPFHYWLAPRRFYLPFAGELERLAGMMADETSRVWLAAVLAFRLGGDYSSLPKPGLDDQYHPADLPSWPDRLRFIDCGAFTGDTLLQLAAAGYSFDAIAAFEPDLGNFKELVHNAARFGSGVFFPCGVAEYAKRIGFSEGQGGGSHIDTAAVERITCVALDEALPGFRPNLIKMDVEGSELHALEGASATIAQGKPALAISLYHHPEHLWLIPFLIDDWKLGYRFYLRGHAQSSFDLVLYALPERGALCP
jgi:FkbM family methyltransferase